MDSHRRVGARRWGCEIAEGAEEIGRGVVRRARAQHRAVFAQEIDISERGKGISGSCIMFCLLCLLRSSEVEETWISLARSWMIRASHT